MAFNLSASLLTSSSNSALATAAFLRNSSEKLSLSSLNAKDEFALVSDVDFSVGDPESEVGGGDDSDVEVLG